MKLKYLVFLLFININLFAAGIEGQKAPSFGVDIWVQNSVKRNLDIDDFKGKVLYLYGFQSWCPGCHSHGFPTLNKLSKHYKNDKDVAFVAIQSVFEGYNFNTSGAAKLIIKKYDLTMPVGHSGTANKTSEFMRNYRSAGTPWIVLIDKKGVVRFNNFHSTVEELIFFIDMLKEEK